MQLLQSANTRRQPPVDHLQDPSGEDRGGIGGSWRPGAGASEGAAAIKEDEDHRRARQGDQRQGSEIGDQVEVDAHERLLQMSFAS